MGDNLTEIKPNRQQAAAIEFLDGAALLLAVPGSGKTTVLTARLGNMIYKKGISPDSVLVLTFTVSAAEEMRSRFTKFFGENRRDRMPEFRTINSLAQHIISVFAARTNRRPFSIPRDEKVINTFLTETYNDITHEFAVDSTLTEIKSLITCVKNKMLTEKEYTQFDREDMPFSQIYERYGAFLRENRLMDFDDQLVYALAMLRNYPKLREEFTQKYKYICVDEAQDTSKIQHCIIKLLTEGNGNLFMVGDEDQSIYGFRGAEPEFLLNFPDKYPGGTVLKSEENFRSAREIIRVSNSFIEKNTMRIQKNMFPSRTDRGVVREDSVEDITAQYAFLVRELPKCKGTTAVLYRNNECALPLIDMLTEKKVSFSFRDNDMSFFTNRTVLDIKSILLLAEDGANTAAFMNLYYKLGLYISKELAERLCSDPRRGHNEILVYLRESGNLGEPARKKCSAVISALHEIRNSTPAAAVGLAATLPGYADGDRSADRGKTEILTALAERQKSIPEFLQSLDDLRAKCLNGSSGDGKLTLSTVHSAKGTEYDTVFIISAVNGILPSIMPDEIETFEDRLLYEEERRLFYVAMTRAKNELRILTFKSEKYGTLFSDEVFAKYRPLKRIAVNPVPKNRFGFTVEASSPSDDFDNESMAVGTRFTHKYFGDGEVTARNGDIITAQFKNGRICRLSVAHLRRKKLAKVR